MGYVGGFIPQNPLDYGTTLRGFRGSAALDAGDEPGFGIGTKITWELNMALGTEDMERIKQEVAGIKDFTSPGWTRKSPRCRKK